jgi:hypothetical protein
MAMGLYDPAFATLAGLYGRAARGPITGITLIAGFASTVGWPLSALLEAHFSWRGACLVWAALNLLIGLPLNRLLIPRAPPPIRPTEVQGTAGPAPRGAMLLLSFVFAQTWFVTGAMAAHLPRLLEIAGASATAAVAAAALVGPAQVGARLVEFGALKRTHPLISARLAAALHPIGAIVLMAIGSPAIMAFAILHGAGNGLLTIAKGTLPLAIFGPVGYGLRSGVLGAPARAAPSWRAADLRPAARPDGSRRARDFRRAQPCSVARVAHAESASGAGACARGVGRDPFALLNLWGHWRRPAACRAQIPHLADYQKASRYDDHKIVGLTLHASGRRALENVPRVVEGGADGRSGFDRSAGARTRAAVRKSLHLILSLDRFLNLKEKFCC